MSVNGRLRSRWLPAGILVLLTAGGIFAQERRSARIDVRHYTIDADINPRTQTLAANVKVQFAAVDDGVSSLAFELNNALNVSKVVDDGGRQIPASRSQQDFTVRLSLPQPLPKGQTAALTFTYDGRLTGSEDSPVYGIKFAALKSDIGYLLYPARWFPVNDYTTDRFTADLRITVPAGYRVVGSGTERSDPTGGEKVIYTLHYDKPSFPGSIAIVQGNPTNISSNGVTTSFYLRSRASMAQAYADEIGKMMAYFTSVFGLPPQANLTVVETESGTPNGYEGPGILFLSPEAIGAQVNVRVLANQIARQWWSDLVSPTTRNHMWIENGAARYAEILYREHANGPNSVEGDIRDTYVEALTVDNPPLIQAARLEDYSPEYWAATAAKGAAVFNMLRWVIGDDAFLKVLKTVPDVYAWKSVNTDDIRKISEQVSGQNLQGFFIQWIESSGAPEFKLEYTVFRTTKGFRVMGKISQDLDTFRMPVDLKIETEGNPEEKRVEVVGTSSEFSVDTFGKPKAVILDPNSRVLRFNPQMRVAVAIRRGEQFVQVAEFNEAFKEYQKALDVARNSSLAHYRVGELFFLQNNYQSAANEFREAINGDLDPKWTEVWSHIKLGNIFDITGQRERALNEYKQALRTKDNTQNALEVAGKYIQAPYERKRIAE
ncbi:MAG TPA: M1 family aminopeptidase [Bryobacteraceae bacterium]|nr:M1 family aminopeptidase [Bryobacteraceae bacterium]